MNRFDRSAEIANADVERVIGGTVEAHDSERLSRSRRGAERRPPVVLEQGALADSLRRLAGDLGGVPKAAAVSVIRCVRPLAFRRA